MVLCMVDISKLHAPSTPPTREAGSTGLRHSQGRTQIFSEFLPQFQGLQNATKIYHQIASNSPIVGASIHAIRSLLRRSPLIIEDSADKPRNARMTELVRRTMTPRMVRDLIDDASSMLIYGFALSEVTLKKDQKTGMYVPKKFAPRAQRSVLDWLWDDTEDEAIAFYQQSWAGKPEALVPLSRCLHFRMSRGEADSPEGSSPLRNAYSSEYFARRLQEVEGVGTERDLSGLISLSIPGEMLDPNATAEQKAALASFQQLIKDIRRDSSEGVLLPSDRDSDGHRYFELELLSTAGNRQVNVGQAIERYEKRIAMSFLTESMFLGISGGAAGSFALADSKTSLFALSLRAILDVISDQLETRLLPMMANANGIDPALMPIIRFGAVEEPAIEDMAQFVERLTNAGFDLSDPATEESLREAASLPAAPSKEDRLKNVKERKELAEAAGIPPGGGPQQDSAPGTGQAAPPKDTARARQSDNAEGKPPTPAKAKSAEVLNFEKGLTGA